MYFDQGGRGTEHKFSPPRCGESQHGRLAQDIQCGFQPAASNEACARMEEVSSLFYCFTFFAQYGTLLGLAVFVGEELTVQNTGIGLLL